MSGTNAFEVSSLFHDLIAITHSLPRFLCLFLRSKTRWFLLKLPSPEISTKGFSLPLVCREREISFPPEGVLRCTFKELPGSAHFLCCCPEVSTAFSKSPPIISLPLLSRRQGPVKERAERRDIQQLKANSSKDASQLQKSKLIQ